MIYHLTDAQLDPPASPLVLEALSSELKVPLPISYLDFLSIHNGGEGFVGNKYIIIWKAEEVARFNIEYEVDVYAPDIVLFGSSGGGEGYGFDTRNSGMPVIKIPFVGMGREYAEHVADDFSELFARLAVL